MATHLRGGSSSRKLASRGITLRRRLVLQESDLDEARPRRGSASTGLSLEESTETDTDKDIMIYGY